MASSDHEPILEVKRSESFTDDLLHGLWEMKSREEMTDFSIKINNNVIPCHSNIMAAASPYFQSLLHTPMKESQNREVELILDAEYVPKVVEYCYTGKITIELSELEVCLDIAEYFQLNALKTKIEEFVCKQLSAKMCISWYFLADKFTLNALKKQTSSMMISNFQDVVKHIEFYELTLKQLIDYIEQAVIIIDGDVVMDACVSWVTYNPQARSESFLDILTHLRLDRCSQTCMEQVSKSWHPMWPNSAEIQKVLDVQCSNIPATLRPSARHVVLLLGGYTDTNVLNRKVWNLDLTNGKCEDMGKMAHFAAKYDSVYCATPKGLFVIGGSRAIKKGNFAKTDDCSLLTLHAMQWEQWPKIGHRTAETVAACIKNHMYIFGGDGSDKAVCCINLNTKVWSSCPGMPVGNVNPIIAAIQEKVFMIFQSYEYNEKFRKSPKIPMYCFDTSTHSWSELSPLPNSMKNTAWAKAVTAGEELFMLGGEERLCAKYSPKNKKWTLLKQPGFVRCQFSVVYMNGQIILFGGFDEDGTVYKTIEVYDIAKNSWKGHELQMPVTLKNHHCSVYDEETGELVV